MYAARARRDLGETLSGLRRFARGEHDNVRNAAIAGLKTVAGTRRRQSLPRSARPETSTQLVMTAANALIGTPRRVDAAAALFAALARITDDWRDTSRDARLAVLGRNGELGRAMDALSLAPYLIDGNAQVADAAAAAIGTLTGLPAPMSAPRPRAVAVPALADIEQLAGARAVVHIAGRGWFEVVLLPDDDAPATVARFVALARAGYYNGLTFHRVVPAFIVQGGSPGANEFSGDAAFMRDEIGLEPHVRGAASISTRGRDTGDAQIWFNLVDNPRLDHDYTVFGRVSAGADVLDRILESRPSSSASSSSRSEWLEKTPDAGRRGRHACARILQAAGDPRGLGCFPSLTPAMPEATVAFPRNRSREAIGACIEINRAQVQRPPVGFGQRRRAVHEAAEVDTVCDARHVADLVRDDPAAARPHRSRRAARRILAEGRPVTRDAHHPHPAGRRCLAKREAHDGMGEQGRGR